ncbi:MAG: sugar phosphate isomerase/epimerase family protein [Puniceicoccaceae bacterium]
MNLNGPSKHNRRQFLGNIALGAAGAGALATTGTSAHAATGKEAECGFKYCLNTSTIRGQKLGIMGEVELAAKVGYDAIEPWVRDIQAFKEEGGSLKELKKRISDHGLTVESAIAFSRWIVDDPEKRKEGLEQAKREMDLVRQIGGTRIAAPPAGATKGEILDLLAVAKRYKKLLELGDEMGVTPALEVWGFSSNLHLLGQSIFAMIEAGHPKACLLPDVYHVYRGGSSFEGFRLLGGTAVPVMHLNDYPAEPSREQLKDADRVYPGDGVAPWGFLIPELRRVNPNMVLSLELFSRDLWELPAEDVARTGLEKMKAVVAKNS